MISQYKAIFKEVVAGNAVFMELKAKHYPYYSRIRIVTSESVEWASLTFNSDFKDSCFSMQDEPAITMQAMYLHDRRYHFEVLGWTVV